MGGHLLDLRSQLGFYKFYHNNPKNVFIHSIFVPTILFSSCCMLHRVTIYHGISLTALLSVFFFLFYCLLYLPTGLLAGLLLLLLNLAPVSYTHLDVYKRQPLHFIFLFLQLSHALLTFDLGLRTLPLRPIVKLYESAEDSVSGPASIWTPFLEVIFVVSRF